ARVGAHAFRRAYARGQPGEDPRGLGGAAGTRPHPRDDGRPRARRGAGADRGPGGAVVRGARAAPARPRRPARSRARDREQGRCASDRSLVAVTLSHSYGFSVLAVPALAHGIPLAFPGAEGVLAAARTLGATFLPSVPAWYRSLLRSAGGASLAPSLRLLVSAGAPLAPEVAREFREHS